MPLHQGHTGECRAFDLRTDQLKQTARETIEPTATSARPRPSSAMHARDDQLGLFILCPAIVNIVNSERRAGETVTLLFSLASYPVFLLPCKVKVVRAAHHRDKATGKAVRLVFPLPCIIV